MRVPILNSKGIKVTQIGSNTICIKEARRHVYLTYEELADIAEAVAQHLEPAAEPFFTEEDLEAGRQAIEKYCQNLPETPV